MARNFLQKWNLFRKKYYLQFSILSLWILGLFLITYFINYTDSYNSLVMQGILPKNRDWTLYTGSGLLVISILILTIGPQEREYEKRIEFIKGVPALKGRLNSLIEAGDYKTAQELFTDNLENVKICAYEDLEYFENSLKKIEKNQFFASRLEIANRALKEGNYPAFHWELGKLSGYLSVEHTTIHRKNLEEYSRLYNFGQELYNRGPR